MTPQDDGTPAAMHDDRDGLPRVALATWVALTRSDRQLLEPLRVLGYAAESVVWSDPGVSWREYAAVVIRSCWDYHHRIAEFLAWIDRLDTQGVLVINRPAIIRWNSSKHYLLEVSARGVPIPPTVVVRRGATDPEIHSLVASLGAHAVVVKPAVSASGHETWRARAPLTATDVARVRGMPADRDVIIQSFMATILDAGELSLVFFDGVYSHAARKRPKPGDFRVQSEHGGCVDFPEVPADIVAQAQRALTNTPAVPTYARVDGIVVDGVFTVMELELIEPELYLTQTPLAGTRFATAIARAVAAAAETPR